MALLNFTVDHNRTSNPNFSCREYFGFFFFKPIDPSKVEKLTPSPSVWKMALHTKISIDFFPLCFFLQWGLLLDFKIGR
jgi:hypothetical protein